MKPAKKRKTVDYKSWKVGWTAYPAILPRFSLHSPRLCGQLSKRLVFRSSVMNQCTNEQTVFTFHFG